jgi:hypothetical protein
MKAAAVALIALTVLLGLSGLPAYGQSIISAQSGLVHFTQGQVFVRDKAVQAERGVFPLVSADQTLRTAAGKAEVLLNPGVFLRLGENSSIRMISTQLTASKVELISGAFIVEAMEINKKSTVAFSLADATVTIGKQGLYRLEVNPPALRVDAGTAIVQSGNRRIEVGKGKMLALDGAWVTKKFDPRVQDDLDTWSFNRANTVATANLSVARTLRSQPGAWASSGWAWNPYWGMFAFMPWTGFYQSPYGFYYPSPRTVNNFSSGPGGVAVRTVVTPRVVDSRARESARSASTGGESISSPPPSSSSSSSNSSSNSSSAPSAPSRSEPDRGSRSR